MITEAPACRAASTRPRRPHRFHLTVNTNSPVMATGCPLIPDRRNDGRGDGYLAEGPSYSPGKLMQVVIVRKPFPRICHHVFHGTGLCFFGAGSGTCPQLPVDHTCDPQASAPFSSAGTAVTSLPAMRSCWDRNSNPCYWPGTIRIFSSGRGQLTVVHYPFHIGSMTCSLFLSQSDGVCDVDHFNVGGAFDDPVVLQSDTVRFRAWRAISRSPSRGWPEEDLHTPGSNRRWNLFGHPYA